MHSRIPNSRNVLFRHAPSTHASPFTSVGLARCFRTYVLQKVKEEFAETRAAIRFSYAQLDRRLQELEGNYASLNERVARLESGRG